MTKLFTVFAFLVLFCSVARADIISDRSGRRYEGERRHDISDWRQPLQPRRPPPPPRVVEIDVPTPVVVPEPDPEPDGSAGYVIVLLSAALAAGMIVQGHQRQRAVA